MTPLLPTIVESLDAEVNISLRECRMSAKSCIMVFGRAKPLLSHHVLLDATIWLSRSFALPED